MGMEWVHLRMCQTCGHIGCCDNSIGKHATAHHQDTGHPIIRSAEPGEDWSWCYVDEVMMRLGRTEGSDHASGVTIAKPGSGSSSSPSSSPTFSRRLRPAAGRSRPGSARSAVPESISFSAWRSIVSVASASAPWRQRAVVEDPVFDRQQVGARRGSVTCQTIASRLPQARGPSSRTFIPSRICATESWARIAGALVSGRGAGDAARAAPRRRPGRSCARSRSRRRSRAARGRRPAAPARPRSPARRRRRG